MSACNIVSIETDILAQTMECGFSHMDIRSDNTDTSIKDTKTVLEDMKTELKDEIKDRIQSVSFDELSRPRGILFMRKVHRTTAAWFGGL